MADLTTRAWRDFAAAIGDQWVMHRDDDRAAYSDHYACDESMHRPAGAGAPADTEQVREVIRVANRHRVPLWTISRGKNFGYGGPAPALKDTVVLDLSRMKAIQVDAENGTVLLEPGVSFFDLYDHLQARRIPLWLSVPGNSWGSVAGNALDRGVGYTSYGDHAARICGLKVVLPDGDLVRTGMGAMRTGSAWQLYRNGFGPGWDAMFCQSYFGGHINVIDVAAEHRSAWRQLRACGPVDIAAGITRWSDFLIVRGHLESRGMRLLESAGHGPMLHWVFVERSG